MATRALVGIKNTDGTIDGIYVHHGSLRDLGDILKKYYTNAIKVRDLIDHGDASYVKKNLDPKGEHDFYYPEQDTCVFYGRDRGESNTDYETYEDEDDFMYGYDADGVDYIYIFDKGGNWKIYDTYNQKFVESLSHKQKSRTRKINIKES